MYTLPADWPTVSWLVDRVAAHAAGDLVLRTRVLDGELRIAIEADSFARAGLGTAQLPAPFLWSEVDGRQRVEGTLWMQASRS